MEDKSIPRMTGENIQSNNRKERCGDTSYCIEDSHLILNDNKTLGRLGLLALRNTGDAPIYDLDASVKFSIFIWDQSRVSF
jgi:hypothetical protein